MSGKKYQELFTHPNKKFVRKNHDFWRDFFHIQNKWDRNTPHLQLLRNQINEEEGHKLTSFVEK